MNDNPGGTMSHPSPIQSARWCALSKEFADRYGLSTLQAAELIDEVLAEVAKERHPTARTEDALRDLVHQIVADQCPTSAPRSAPPASGVEQRRRRLGVRRERPILRLIQGRQSAAGVATQHGAGLST